ncbi:MAG: hypothetical protein ACJARO_001860 [Bacteriovoracaceae bacterium]|jgi:hypothetical protein|tara:strand:- start:1928 stop:2746 length:819 start_codon:yes stop_codon:yes gene_type:complete
MSVQFKNMKASVGSQDYFAESISISESIDLEYFSALGTKSQGVIASAPPEGTFSIDFYITTGNEISNIKNSYGSAAFSEVRAGPFIMKKALLTSFSVNGDPSSIIKGSATYNYYGQMTSGGSPSKSDVTIIPAHGASSSGQLDSLGVSRFLNFSYSFSQSFDVNYSISGEQPSKVVFNGGSQDLSLEVLMSDIDFDKTAMTGSSGLCLSQDGQTGLTARIAEVNLYNLCGNHVSDLPMSGYLTERSISTAPGSEVIESITITQKYVKDEDCP